MASNLGNLASVKQQKAANPNSSIWVNASAGTGKTKVLTDRVLNILLNGGDPSKILCLTFTRAAAAEMQGRIYSTLSRWSILSDNDLLAQIKGLGFDVESLPQPEREELLSLARGLFSKVINMSEGLKIYTIHAFCQSILAKFPVEAGIVPGSKVADEVLLRNILKSAIDKAIKDEGSKQSLFLIAEKMTFETFLEVVSALQTNEILETLSDENLIQKIKQAILCGGNSDIRNSSYDDSYGFVINRDRLILSFIRERSSERLAFLQSIISVIEKNGTDNDKKKLFALRHMLDTLVNEDVDNKKDIVTIFADYVDVFLTKAGQFRKRLFTKKVMDGLCDSLKAFVEKEITIIGFLVDKIKAFENYELNRAIITFGRKVLEHYEIEKKFHGVLDYNDLISKTVELLERKDISPWVLYKLDGGIDHILLDEAQDTSPSQWDVIKAIATEFFHDEKDNVATGSGNKPMERTLFVVGDEKQSIYSFQGADPIKFHQMKEHFAGKSIEYKKSYLDVDLDTSFRSTKAVLEIVDKIFNDPDIKKRVCLRLSEEFQLEHKVFRDADYGRVELWPAIVKDKDKAVEDKEKVEEKAKADSGSTIADQLFQQHLSEVGAIKSRDVPSDLDNDVPIELLEAKRIAKQIKYWLDKKVILPSKGRYIEPGDVMVLVQSRSTFIDYLIRELRNNNIPVAGRDRILLNDEIAIKDLVALGKFLIFPGDDFSLACVLKSPIFGVSEEELFELCCLDTNTCDSRDNNQKIKLSDDATLFSKLRFLATSESQDSLSQKKYLYIYEKLKAMLAMVDYETPFALYGKIMDGHYFGNIRARFIKRLGDIASEQINEFLNLLLAFESENPPSLELFLNWFVSQSSEIKRDFESVKAVRIMTVHGSKGLQAPIVFMPDTFKKPRFKAKIMRVFDQGIDSHLLLYNSASDQSSMVVEKYKSLMNSQVFSESLRLLYVAMTRAEDKLIISGYANSGANDDGLDGDNSEGRANSDCWYNIIKTHMQNLHGVVERVNPATSEAGLVYEPLSFSEVDMNIKESSCANDNNAMGHSSDSKAIADLPEWLLNNEIKHENKNSNNDVSNDDIDFISPSLVGGGADYDGQLRGDKDHGDHDNSNKEKSIARGIIIHKLLELYSPSISMDVESFEGMALSYINKISDFEFNDKEKLEMIQKVVGVVESFPEIFQSGNSDVIILREQPFIAKGGDNNKAEVVKGVIDKAIINKEQKEIMVIDYKTGAKKDSLQYKTQLRYYLGAAQKIFKDFKGRAFILWVDEKELEEVSAISK